MVCLMPSRSSVVPSAEPFVVLLVSAVSFLR